ncbi:MAG: transglutaminase domain-containing protein [Thermoplasmata archaeon]
MVETKGRNLRDGQLPPKPAALQPPPARPGPEWTMDGAPQTARTPAPSPSTPRSSPGPLHPYYQPPPYQPRQPFQVAGASASSSLEEWQRSRAAAPVLEEHEEQLRRSLLRPQPGEEAPAPLGGDASYPSVSGPFYTPAVAGSQVPLGVTRPPLPSRPRTRSHWPVVKGVTVIVVTALVLGVLQASGAMAGFREFLDRDLYKGLPVYRSYPLSSEFEFNRVMVTRTSGGIVEYSVDISIPATIPGQQEVVSLTTNPTPTSSTATRWTWSGTLTGGRDLQVVIGYHARATFKQWKLKPADSGTVSDIPPSYSKYLGDCWKFQPSNPTVRELAQRLAGGTRNVLEKVTRVYEYIRANIAYMSNSPEEPKDPVRTLSERNGDCDDQSYLFGSLLRAQGVPVWMELGLLYDQSRRAWGGHAWVRVYIPLKSGGGEVVNIDTANDQFLFRDANRLTDYIDDGDAGHLQSYYVSWRFTYTGPPPVREDRYDALRFTPSDKTVIIERSGPGPGAQAVGELWKMPGLEAGATAFSVAVALVLIQIRRHRTFLHHRS